MVYKILNGTGHHYEQNKVWCTTTVTRETAVPALPGGLSLFTTCLVYPSRIPQADYEEEMRLPSAGGTGDGGHCCRCAVPGALFLRCDKIHANRVVGSTWDLGLMIQPAEGNLSTSTVVSARRQFASAETNRTSSTY